MVNLLKFMFAKDSYTSPNRKEQCPNTTGSIDDISKKHIDSCVTFKIYSHYFKMNFINSKKI